MEKNNFDDILGYNINDTDISVAREVTKKCNGKRFRILLEIVTSCFGNCSGCSLSYAHRKDLTPSMSIEQIQKTLNYFIPIVNKKEQIRTTIVNLGTGDYFLMDKDFLLSLFKTIRIFFDQLHTVRNVLSMSTSLFLPEEKMLEKIGAMKQYLHETQFAIDGVVDPAMLEKHYYRYIKNYQSISKHFPFFDLVVNISDAVTPNDIKKLTYFFKEMGILNFDIQYAINNTNTYRVKTNQSKFNEILDTIHDALGDEVDNVLNLSIAIPTTKKTDEVDSIFEIMKGHAKEIAKERVLVKPNGNIHPIGFGYGDILLDERYDFPAIGNINSDFDEAKAEEIIFNFLKDIFIKNKKCHTCEYNLQCYSTGYSFYNKFDNNKLDCENVGRYIFKKLQTI